MEHMLPESLNPDLLYRVVAVVLLAVLLQRLIFKYNTRNLLPVWAPIEIGLTGYAIQNGGLVSRIISSIRRHGGSLFGLTSTHQILINFSDVDRFMARSHHTLSFEPVQYTILTRVFGASDTPDLKKKIEDAWKELLTPLERAFLNDTTATASIEKANVSQKTASFVTFSADTRDMKRWEQSAGIQVITPDSSDGRGVVEANLHSLVRDFGACISIPVLYGQDFMDRYPQLLDDLWKFDNDLYALLMIGIPSWAPFKVVREAVAARSRLVNEMEGLFRRINQYQRGESIDFDADMSDIGSVASERNKIYEREKWSMRNRGETDLVILWGQNGNTQPVLFWFMAYVYSTAGLLEKLRTEIAPYIKTSQTYPPEITSMDLQALSQVCPLLKASIFETYRMAVEATSIRYVAQSVNLNDGASKYELKPGTWVSVPNWVSQQDPSIYADPEEFIPDRFLETDPESGKLTARYGKLRPWGLGSGMCKGRTFAEKEIVAVGAAIMTLWDIEPASGTWKIPTKVPGTGAKKPAEDIRVIIKRREIR